MRAIIYSRVSCVGDRQNTERQTKSLTEYANNNSIELVKVFDEHVSGGKKNSDRPVFTAAL